MIAVSTNQELQALREESDWVAKQLEQLQRVVIHVSSAEGQLTERRPLA